MEHRLAYRCSVGLVRGEHHLGGVSRRATRRRYDRRHRDLLWNSWGPSLFVVRLCTRLEASSCTFGQAQGFSLYAPLVFAPLLVAFVTAMGFVPLGSAKPFSTALYFAGWAVGVGYAYVGTVHLGFFVLRRLGAFKVAYER